MSGLSIVIQAGGKSSRIGRDKSFLTIRGIPLIQRIIDEVSILGDDLIITSNEPEKFVNYNARVVSDEFPGVGALAGIHAGIKAAKNDLVCIVANDMPFISLNLFRYMHSQFSSAFDLVIPSSPRGYEPFHAIYRKSTCLPAIEKAIINQERRIISWFGAVKIREISVDEYVEYDPAETAFFNINTPEDLKLAEEKIND